MKSALTVVLFRLFAIGVFADGKETSDGELVSVMEGDSVTLKSGVTDVQTVDEIEWRFNGTRIEKFGDRLQLDAQTRDLKISNIRTTDSGLYKVKISSTDGSSEIIFTVKVVSAGGVKPLTVMEGDSVILRTDLTEMQRDDVIQWRFGQQESTVAGKTVNVFTSNGPDKRFRGRLRQDSQTGSLIITDITATDSGVYEVDISTSSSRYTIHKSFSVTVSADVKPVSVMEGDNVTLHTGLTKIQRDDEILWKFGDQDKPVASLNGPGNKNWSNIDLNPQTGDLTIINIQRDGDYKVEINTSRVILHRKYQINMIDEMKSVSVKEGESVTLQIVSEIQSDDLIHWMFGDFVIAEIHKAAQRFSTSDVPDRRFRVRLDLDHQTGSLIIMNTRITDSGDYQLKINSSRFTINRRIPVTVTAVSGSGLSSAAVAGIVIGVLVVVAAAAAAAGVIYHRHKISELKSQRGDNLEQNGGNHEKQDTDDPANEETKLANDP